MSIGKENARSKGISNSSKKEEEIGKRHIAEEDISIVNIKVKDIGKEVRHI